MKVIKKTLIELDKHRNAMDFRRGISLKEITAFESKKALNFPIDFKEWLKKSNGGEIFIPGTLMYAIPVYDMFEPVDAMYDMELANQNTTFNIPKNYYVIGKLNFGDLICIQIDGGRCLIQWDHETDSEFLSWNSFTEWLNEAILDYEGNK